MRALLVVATVLGGCALLQPPSPKPAALTSLGAGEIPSAPGAAEALVIGSSTKADVRAALGEGSVVDFTSGYEVWVYRERSPTPSAELVLLFAPSGVLTKTRVR